MTKDLKGDRWTCPNDRNLQLRSKLNAGWSIHTGKKTVKKDPQLTETELIEIQKVLQRSEILEKNEKDRVMKLVDRLENMKRNAIQTGSSLSSNRCSLCGDYFCLIRTAPTQCNSCKMILCSKCCIDTECTVENDLFSKTSQSRKNSSTNLSVTNGLIGSTSNFSKTVYLCRICSEQREFLKKSGAWFLKKFPNYLSDGLNTKLKSTSTSNVNQIEYTKTSPTETKPNFFFSPATLKRNISVSPSNSSSLRMWKFKENDVNHGIDYVSDYSIDNDRNENSNCECNKTKTSFKENSDKSPTWLNKTYETFQFNMNSSTLKDSENSHPKFLKNKNTSPIHSPILTPIKSFNNISTANLANEKKKKSLNSYSTNSDFSEESMKNSCSNYQNMFECKKNTEFSNSNNLSNETQRFKKSKDSCTINDDDSLSANMENYYYYSTIITNMNDPLENKKEIDLLSKKFRQEKPSNEEHNKNFDKLKNSKKEYRSKNRSISSITDEVFNNSLSASASNLNFEANFDKNRNYHFKCATAKLSRKNKNDEWSRAQLSIDHKNSFDSIDDNKSFKIEKVKQLASSCSENTGSSLIVNGMRPKISSSIINNLAKKISSQNSSAIDSVAGNSSSAVHSVSSLATSLSKVN